MTIQQRLSKILEPFIGSEICPENTKKMKALILEELPQLPPEVVEAAVVGILSKIPPK